MKRSSATSLVALALVTLTSLGLSSLASSARAQGAELEPCPLGATETDVTLSFRNNGTGTTCGPNRNSGNGGACDDGSLLYDVYRTNIWGNGTQPGDGFPFAFSRWPSFWLNINGNLSFGAPISTYTPDAIPGLERPAIAPYFADVDLTNRSGQPANPGQVLICEDPANKRIMFTWKNVGYYNALYPAGRLNSFQVILKDEGQVCVDPLVGVVRGLSIEFRFKTLVWYVGQASGSNADGTCNVGTSIEEGGQCVPAVVGFDTGDNINAFQVEGTRQRAVNEILLAGDGGGAIAPGVYKFLLLNGDALPSVCGDGVRDLCEACDDGELNGISCCRSDCSSAQVNEICGGGNGTCVIDNPDLICLCDNGYEFDGVACVYSVPTANAGPDQTVARSSVVALTGLLSTDPRGRPLTYTWTQTGGPAVALTGANTAAPTFTAPGTAATLTFQLQVCNASSLCATDTVVVTSIASPIANAGPDKSSSAGGSVSLDGTGSSDPQSLALTYTWTQTGGPAVALTGANTASPSFTAPTGPATLTFQLQVCNSFGLCTTDTVVATVVSGPLANAGPDQTVNQAAAVNLTGAGSSDPQGQALTYSWTQTGGTNVALTGATTASPSFTAPTGPASLTFQLQVCNASSLCATDTVVVTVRGAPTANAGPDQSVNQATPVSLTAAGSTDPQGLALTYTWTQTGGANTPLTGANTATPGFTAPTGPATLTYQVQVCNTAGLCATDTVVVTVRGAPTANAGPDQTVNEATSVSLSSSGSTDPQGQALTTTWTQTGGTNVALTGANTATPSFTAPTGPATLTFQARVCNTSGLCANDTVVVTVVGSPTANAGPDQTVNPQTPVTLAGGSSSDPQGQALTYTWTQTGGPNVALTGANTATPGFTSPNGPATLTFQVQVCNASGLCKTDTVTVTVRGAPTANAGPDQTVDEGAAVALTGAASTDPQGQALTYAWTQTGGPNVALTGANTATPGFTAPEGPATLTFQLQVCNTSGLCATDTVSVSVTGKPTASAGPDQTVPGLSEVELDASASTDPQGEALTYTWTQTSGPEVAIDGANTASPSFTAPDGPATLTFQVTVCNASGLCETDTVTVNVACRAGYAVVGGVCTDIDECASAELNDCDANAACTNTPGAYTCECKDGFTGNGEACADIDECASTELNTCDPNATCTNTAGNFTCQCKDGFSGDGQTCDAVDQGFLASGGGGCGGASTTTSWATLGLALLALGLYRRRARG